MSAHEQGRRDCPVCGGSGMACPACFPSATELDLLKAQRDYLLRCIDKLAEQVTDQQRMRAALVQARAFFRAQDAAGERDDYGPHMDGHRSECPGCIAVDAEKADIERLRGIAVDAIAAALGEEP